MAKVLIGHNKEQMGHLLVGHGSSSASAPAEGIAAYALAGALPLYVMDTENGFYYDGTYYDGPNQLHDHTTTSARTVVDSDGLIKWAPMNLAANPAAPATQSITVVVGNKYRVNVIGSGSMALSGAGTGTASQGSPADITATTTTLTITLSGSLDYVGVHRNEFSVQASGSTIANWYVPETAYWTGTYYNPTTGVVRGVLGEPEATNLFTHSADISSINWTKRLCVVGAQSSVGPTGSARPVTASANDPNPAQVYQVGKTLTNGADYLIWAIVKNSSSDWFALNIFDTTDTNVRAWFNLATGAKGSAAASISDFNIIDFGGGWFLCWAVRAVSSTSGGGALEIVNGDGVTTVTSGDSVLIAASSFVQESTLSSYIPTVGATATRAASNVSKPLSEISADLDEIVVVTEFECDRVAADAVIAALDNAGTDLIHFRAHTSQANLFVQDSGATQADVDAGAISANTQYRAAFKMAANDFIASLDGATAVADTSGTMPTPTTLRLFNSNGAAPLAGIRIKKLIIYAGATGSLDSIDATAIEGAAA